MARSPKISRPIYKPEQIEDAPAPSREPNFDLLDEETKDRLRKDALAKVEAREIALAEKAFLDKEIQRLSLELRPEEVEEERDIDLSYFRWPEIRLDGKVYQGGRKYTVRKSVYDAMMEIIDKTERHESEITSGMNTGNYYNRLKSGDPTSKQFGVGKTISASNGARQGF